jgi:hypothetical protein
VAEAMRLEAEDGEVKFIIAMDAEEAATLQHILGTVSGHTEMSRRKYTDRVATALDSIGVSWPGFRTRGSVRFLDEDE